MVGPIGPIEPLYGGDWPKWVQRLYRRQIERVRAERYAAKLTPVEDFGNAGYAKLCLGSALMEASGGFLGVGSVDAITVMSSGPDFSTTLVCTVTHPTTHRCLCAKFTVDQHVHDAMLSSVARQFVSAFLRGPADGESNVIVPEETV